MGRDFFELYELQSLLKEGIEGIVPQRVWVRAEISQMKARTGGHCYLDLCQSEDGVLLAKVKAVIWASRYRVISACFEEVTGMRLSEGMQAMLEVQVTYSQLYGLTLVVNDINPEFTMGSKQREREQTIERLRAEGLMDLQKGLALPVLPYRIAVVSAPDAAGYRDFMKHLAGNEYGFAYDVRLFPAVVQGADAPQSVGAALELVAEAEEPFDVVMIMRGGGARMDMDCFDDYSLARAVALCPLPVITGIGHDQDYHIADMVACEYVKTPTALADWLIDTYAREDESVAYYATRLRLAFSSKIQAMESRVEMLRTRIQPADPRNVLKRGYTLTLDGGGKVARSAAPFRRGDRLSVMFPDGTVNCEVC